jgi:hypothetical protein
MVSIYGILIYRSEYRAGSRMDLSLCSTLPCGREEGHVNYRNNRLVGNFTGGSCRRECKSVNVMRDWASGRLTRTEMCVHWPGHIYLGIVLKKTSEPLFLIRFIIWVLLASDYIPIVVA